MTTISKPARSRTRFALVAYRLTTAAMSGSAIMWVVFMVIGR